MNRLYLDIETNLAHDKIWCCCCLDSEGRELYITSEDKQDLQAIIDQYDTVVAHNLIRFDKPVLERVWGIVIPEEKCRDTLVLSRLYNPNIEGGHSLKNLGALTGVQKLDFDVEDFDGGLTDEMLEYCQRDVEALKAVDLWLEAKLKQWGKPEQSIELEHKVARLMYEQERNGFKLNEQYAVSLLGELNSRMAVIEGELQQVFPPIVTERISEKTGKRLKDDVEVFKVGSRQQIAKRLQQKGAVFTKKTEKGSVIVDESVLSEIDLPEAKLCLEYLTIQKMVGMLNQWLDKLESDGRVRGKVNSNGAVTGRMTQNSPNMAQVPSVTPVYGKQARTCWTVDKGNKLVGCDLSGIELRCLAHYMQDDEWTKELLEGDIHTKNQLAAGLEERSQAKTMIYATLYGAGTAKIGSIVGGGRDRGKKIMDNFYKNTPALKKLKEKVGRIAEKGYLPALDKRRLIVRSEHSALNTLLQSAGAIVAKQWLVESDELFKQNNIQQYVKRVVTAHDEQQLEVKEEYAEQVGKLCVEAAQLAADKLGFRVRVDAEYKIGDNWLETH